MSDIRLIVDETHMGRRASGIERITKTLFSRAAFPELDVVSVRSSGNRASMMFAQSIAIPLRALRHRDAVWVFPGYPPSAVFSTVSSRAAYYVHDLFLLTRPEDLNLAARVYMAPSFRKALSKFGTFLVNSEATADQLRVHVRPEAEIVLYRPVVENVFGLQPRRVYTRSADQPIILGALGTIEPRKNYLAAAAIRDALEAHLNRTVLLHIVGRPGWGGEVDRLATKPNVVLHGFLDDDRMRSVVDTFDAFICTSHAEGLGLPLLEMQYAGLPMVAPDQPVFRQVLGDRGIFIDPQDARGAAMVIAEHLSPESLTALGANSLENIRRWNDSAQSDRQAVLRHFRKLAGRPV